MYSKIIEEDILLHEIRKFRTAIINSNEFPAFPTGCCGISSKFLAKYLVEEIGLNPKNIFFIHTDLDDDTHAWLLINGVNYDMTANQFPEFAEDIVFWENWIWGKRFEEKNLNKVRYNEIDIIKKMDCYNSILTFLNNTL